MSHTKSVILTAIFVFGFSAAAFDPPTVVYERTFEIPTSVATVQKKQKVSFQEVLNGVAPGLHYVEVIKTGSKDLDVRIQVNKNRLDIDSCGRSPEEELEALTLRENNRLELEISGRSGDRISLRIFDIRNTSLVQPPVEISAKRGAPSSVSFTTPSAGSLYFLVLKDIDRKSSKVNVLLNGNSVASRKDIKGRHPMVKLVPLDASNEIVVSSSSKNFENIEVSVLAFKIAPNGDETTPDSPAELSITGLRTDVPNSLESQITLVLSGGDFSESVEEFQAFRNGVHIQTAAFARLAPKVVQVNGLLANGPNKIEIFARDQNGDALRVGGEYWAGSNTLRINALDSAGQAYLQPVNVSVSLAVGEDSYSFTQIAQNGLVTIENLPVGDLTMVLHNSQKSGVFAVDLNGDLITSISLYDNAPVVPPTNLDYSQGLFGWQVNAGTVEVEEIETFVEVFPSEARVPSLLAVPEGGIRSVLGISVSSTSFDPFRNNWNGSGSTSISVPEGTRYISVSYSLSRTSPDIHGGVHIYSDDYPGIPLPQITASGNGKDFWEVAVPLSGRAQNVYIQILASSNERAAAKVSVGAFRLNALAIDVITLLDIPIPTSINFLSVGATNPNFCNGNVPVNMGLRVRGFPNDRITKVQLKLQQEAEGSPPVYADLNPRFLQFDNRIGAPLGVALEFAPSTTTPVCDAVFSIPRADSELFQVNNGRVKATFKITTELGEVVSHLDTEIPRRRFLMRYLGANRFPAEIGFRDLAVGGDDWARPYVLNALRTFNQRLAIHKVATEEEFGFFLNDMSNMHGGKWPDHEAHLNGYNADARISSFPVRAADGTAPLPSAQAARQLVNFIRVVGWENIANILVSYRAVPGDPFYEVIRNEQFGSRPGLQLIKSDEKLGLKHRTHFHINFWSDQRVQF